MIHNKSVLTGLQADSFRHPLDLEATRSLKQFPGLDLLVRSLLGALGEKFFYLENISSSVLVSDRQLPEYYQLLVDAAQILDVDCPQLYIRQNPIPNAYTFAMRGRQPFIMIHTSLLDLLTLEETQAVIAHELGHLKCEHGVYLTLANLITLAADRIPSWGGVMAQSLRSQMLEWVRCAEFSCDRAALLVAQDPRVVMSVLMKLTGGSPKLADRLNLDAFLAQARAYDRVSGDGLGELLRQTQTEPLTHPLPVLRAREIDRWASSSVYQDLLNGDRMRYTSESETKGGWRNW